MTQYIKKLQFLLLRYLREKEAATAVEYGLIVGFISVMIMITVFAIGDQLNGFFDVIHNYLSSVL
jgi:Flp pilus assembly pilin Flp